MSDIDSDSSMTEIPIAQDITPIQNRSEERGTGNLSTDDKVCMLNILHSYYCLKKRKLQHGCITTVEKLFNVNRSTVRYVWAARGKGTPKSLMTNSGRKPKDISSRLGQIPLVQLYKRTTIRSTCNAIGVS